MCLSPCSLSCPSLLVPGPLRSLPGRSPLGPPPSLDDWALALPPVGPGLPPWLPSPCRPGVPPLVLSPRVVAPRSPVPPVSCAAASAASSPGDLDARWALVCCSLPLLCPSASPPTHLSAAVFPAVPRLVPGPGPFLVLLVVASWRLLLPRSSCCVRSGSADAAPPAVPAGDRLLLRLRSTGDPGLNLSGGLVRRVVLLRAVCAASVASGPGCDVPPSWQRFSMASSSLRNDSPSSPAIARWIPANRSCDAMLFSQLLETRWPLSSALLLFPSAPSLLRPITFWTTIPIIPHPLTLPSRALLLTLSWPRALNSSLALLRGPFP